jgi:hypothetical protein
LTSAEKSQEKAGDAEPSRRLDADRLPKLVQSSMFAILMLTANSRGVKVTIASMKRKKQQPGWN